MSVEEVGGVGGLGEDAEVVYHRPREAGHVVVCERTQLRMGTRHITSLCERTQLRMGRRQNTSLRQCAKQDSGKRQYP